MATVTETQLPDHFENEQAMNAVVEKVFADRAAAKAAESPKQEPAPKVVERKPTIETPIVADETPGSSDTVVESSDEGKVETSVQDWIDIETQDLASRLGISKEVLAEFDNRIELDRFLDFVEKREFENAKKNKAATTPQTPLEEKPAIQKPEQQGSVAPISDDLKPFLLDENIIEEAAAKPHNEFVKAMAAELKSLKSQIAQQESRFKQAGQQDRVTAVTAKFDSTADSLGHDELLGKLATKTAEQHKSRDRLFGAIIDLANIRKMPVEAALADPAVVKRALHMEFGDTLIKQATKVRNTKLQVQAARKMGGPSGKGVKEVDNGKGSPAENPAKMEYLKKEFDRLQNE